MRKTRGIPALIIAVAAAVMLPFAHVTLSQGHSISGRILVDGRRHNYGVIVWVDTQHMTMTDSLGDYEIGGLGEDQGVIRSTADYGCLWQGERRDGPAARADIRTALEWGGNLVAYALSRRKRGT